MTSRRGEATAAPIERLTLQVNGLDLHVAASGPEDAPLVVLLHGFPEFSYGWRHQLPALGEAGFRVVAPDQRGYGLSSKPEGVRAYALDLLAGDVVALAGALGHRRFTLVGHDWGGIVAWHLASRHPEHLQGLAILNAPHLGVVPSHALRHPMQLLRSSYVGFFQLPFVPELALAADGHRLLVLALEGSSRPGTFTPQEIEAYRDAWRQEGALTAMLNWYRAIPFAGTAKADRKIEVPVRILWGDADTALESSLAEACAGLCADAVVTHLPHATHWLHHEEVDEVNRLLLEFLERSAGLARRTPAHRRQKSDVVSAD